MQKLSHMDGLFAKGSTFALAQLQAVVSQARAYLKRLAENGLHLIYTVPWFAIARKSKFGFTSVAFQVVSKTEVTANNCNRICDSPVLLIFGMSGSRPSPLIGTMWSKEFSIWKGLAASYGTLCLSKDTFLKAYLLDRLSAINAKTTVLPRHPLDGEDDNMICLITYSQARRHRRNLCEWKLRHASQSSDILQYYHDFKSQRRYLERGRGDIDGKRMYSLVCESLPPSEKLRLTVRNLPGHTRSKLLIPTTYHPGGLEITLCGETTLLLFNEDDDNPWR